MVNDFNEEMFGRIGAELILEHIDHGGWQDSDAGLACAKDGEVVSPTPETALSWYEQHQATRCFCGKPLHYTSASDQKRVQAIIDEMGRWQKLTILGIGSFAVDRHYIALHGVTGSQVEALGFKQMS